MSLSFKEFITLSEGPPPMGAPPAAPSTEPINISSLFRALGIRPKDLKGAVMSGSNIGIDDKNLKNVGVFKVKDVDEKNGRIKGADIEMYANDELGPSGMEDMVKRGDKWLKKPDEKRLKAYANIKWLKDLWSQPTNPGGASAGASGALPGPNGVAAAPGSMM
jgi:hypothetical protein